MIVAAGQNASRAKRYVISDYGAVGDGRTVNTKAIQAAIDKSSTSGGGLVVIPRGTFLSGAIFLKQGVNLYVETNAILKGTTNPDDYPIIQTRWEGTEEPWTSAFVNADGVTDLEISGEGTIDRSGDEWLRNRRSAAPDRYSEFKTRSRDEPESSQPGRMVPVLPVQRRCACGKSEDHRGP